MANKSDFGSVLPRFIKKQLSLSQIVTGDVSRHRAGELRRSFISAHEIHQEVVRKRLTLKSDGIEDVEAS